LRPYNKDSGIAHSIAAVYSAHESIIFQPVELQVGQRRFTPA